jgi:UDP-glucose 4-epimerase
MKAFITGGAGFIGSNMADLLLKKGYEVTVYDNFSTGQKIFVQHNLDNTKYKLVQADVLDLATLTKEMQNHDVVFHFQANADVRGGIKNTRIDIQQNIIATHNVLEAIRVNNIKNIIFSSSATVYGEPDIFPTPENIAPLQTSIYGASKFSGEALIQAYCEYFDIKSWIFRFVSFIGKRYTHGVIFDFMKKLLQNPHKLQILGDGQQQKSYLHVEDGVNAIYTAFSKAKNKINIFNLGNLEYINVVDLANILTTRMDLQNVEYQFTGGKRGWIGDSPFVHLDVQKIQKLGWKPKYSIPEAINDTVDYLMKNKQLFQLRK